MEVAAETSEVDRLAVQLESAITNDAPRNCVPIRISVGRTLSTGSRVGEARAVDRWQRGQAASTPDEASRGKAPGQRVPIPSGPPGQVCTPSWTANISVGAAQDGNDSRSASTTGAHVIAPVHAFGALSRHNDPVLRQRGWARVVGGMSVVGGRVVKRAPWRGAASAACLCTCS